MQSQTRKERFFSIELNSKDQIKSISMSNGEPKESTLIEGTIGNFVEAFYTEGVVLEVTGTMGVLRIDLPQQEVKTSGSGGD